MSFSAETVETWNRKLHYYLGLYFLLFVWLYSFTGLLLNHPAWRFTQFWPLRKESTQTLRIQTPGGASAGERASVLAAQLELTGEIDVPNPGAPPGQLNFRVSKPGRIVEVRADLERGTATVKRIQVNAWGVMNMLHTFTGVRRNEPSMRRDWLLTKLWSFSMDALSAGLLFMIFSSYYMWYRLGRKRRLGVISLALGVVGCGYFVFLPWWIRG